MRLQNIIQAAGFTVGGILLVILIIIYNLNTAIMAILQLKSFYIVFAVLAFLAYAVSRYLPWIYLIRKTGVKMGILRSFLMMQAYFNLAFLPILLQFVSLKYLDKFKKNARLFSGSIMISTGTTAFLAIIFMALITSLSVSAYIPYLVALVAAVYLLMSVLGREALMRRALKWVNKLNHRLKSHLIKSGMRYLAMLKKTRAFLSQKDIAFETLLFMPTLLFEDLLVYFLLLAFNQHLSIFTVIFFFSLSDIIGLISLLPLGIGALDISFIGFMAALGVPGAIALSTMLIYRLFINIILPIFGYMCLVGLRFLTRRKSISGRRA